MGQRIESILYIDPQAQKPAGYCSRCGGAVYFPGCRCIRCGRDEK